MRACHELISLLTPSSLQNLYTHSRLCTHSHSPRGYILRYLRQIAVITPYAQVRNFVCGRVILRVCMEGGGCSRVYLH